VENRLKPKVDHPQPKDIADANEVIARSKLMFNLIRFTLQTDGTRVVTLSLSTFSVVPHVLGVKSETRGLTHYGNEPDKIAELKKIEEAQMKAFGDLLKAFQSLNETGGGFKHGQHLALNTTKNTPVANLFVSMLQGLGIEADKFASSTGTLNGLKT
jgi:hypothetical protein